MLQYRYVKVNRRGMHEQVKALYKFIQEHQQTIATDPCLLFLRQYSYDV
jgi:hypothetical protein